MECCIEWFSQVLLPSKKINRHIDRKRNLTELSLSYTSFDLRNNILNCNKIVHKHLIYEFFILSIALFTCEGARNANDNSLIYADFKSYQWRKYVQHITQFGHFISKQLYNDKVNEITTYSVQSRTTKLYFKVKKCLGQVVECTTV